MALFTGLRLTITSTPQRTVSSANAAKKMSVACMLRRHPLFPRLLGFVLPFADLVMVNAAERQQFLLVIDHFLTRLPGERIILHQENRFLGTNFLAITTEDAAEHVYLKFLRRLLDV